MAILVNWHVYIGVSTRVADYSCFLSFQSINENFYCLIIIFKISTIIDTFVHGRRKKSDLL